MAAIIGVAGIIRWDPFPFPLALKNSTCYLVWTHCSISTGRAGTEKDSLFLTCRPKRKFSKPKYSFSQKAAFWGIV